MTDIGNLEELMMEIKQTVQPELHSSRMKCFRGWIPGPRRSITQCDLIQAALEINPARRLELDEPDGTEHLPMTP
jgi:hypothetical protein